MSNRECRVCGASDVLLFKTGALHPADTEGYTCATGCNP